MTKDETRKALARIAGALGGVEEDEAIHLRNAKLSIGPYMLTVLYGPDHMVMLPYSAVKYLEVNGADLYICLSEGGAIFMDNVGEGKEEAV